MEEKKIRVAITHGDTNGVGYEMILKAFGEPEMMELCTPVVYGSPKVAAYHNKALGLKAGFSIINNAEEVTDGKMNMLTCMEEEVKIDFGMATEESGEAAMKALDRAMTDFRDGSFDALVCAPVCKDNMKMAGMPFKSLAAYINTCMGEGSQCLPVYFNDTMRVAILADDAPMKDVADNVTEQNIINKVKMLHQSLKRDFRIYNPRIAVLAYNATADGSEEKEAIVPAINALAEEGVQAFGPYAAETFFKQNMGQHFDAILAMYHDQGLLPMRSMGTTDDCIFYAGLPLICTAPDTDAQLDIAGKNLAEGDNLRNAVYAAIDIFRNRKTYDEPLANPLPKLYHDKRDEEDRPRIKKRPYLPNTKDPNAKPPVDNDEPRPHHQKAEGA